MTKIRSEMQNIKKVIKEVAATHSEDGFSFTWFSAEELNQPHMEYTGFRIILNPQFGKMYTRQKQFLQKKLKQLFLKVPSIVE